MSIDKTRMRLKQKFSKTHPLLHEAVRIIAIVIGAAMVAVGLEFFLVPNGFLDGGVTGVSIILSNMLNLPLGLLLAILNAPFVILAWRVSGFRTALRTIIGIGVLSVLTLIFHHREPFTEEFVLALGYGGVLLGVGVGLALRYGGALDGIESLAHILSERTSIDVDKFILAFNFLLFIIAAFIFTPEQAMASFLLFYIVVAPMINKLTASTDYKTVQIISIKSLEIAAILEVKMHCKVILDSAKRLDGTALEMITTFIPRIEESTLVEYVDELDPAAVIIVNDATTVLGRKTH